MALRYLYRKLSLEERICPRCEKPILRNLALDKEGCPWHYGCLQEEKAKRFKCLDCFSVLTGLETTWTYFGGVRVRACGNCGSTQITGGKVA